MPIVPSPVNAFTETSASRATRSSASWNGSVLNVKIEGRIGDLDAKLFAQIRDAVARLLLDQAEGLAEPDALGLNRHPARVGVGLFLGFP